MQHLGEAAKGPNRKWLVQWRIGQRWHSAFSGPRSLALLGLYGGHWLTNSKIYVEVRPRVEKSQLNRDQHVELRTLTAIPEPTDSAFCTLEMFGGKIVPIPNTTAFFPYYS